MLQDVLSKHTVPHTAFKYARTPARCAILEQRDVSPIP